jgi:hypothetical protein
LWFAFGISPYGMRLRADGMRGADARSQGHRGQRGASTSKREHGLLDKIMRAGPRRYRATATDAPQGHCRLKTGPHPTRLNPTPSLADILPS